ncbi:MAG: late competence development ComFB family protein [Peptococcaceae bacterium]|jgi:competence protein ComFB|nr:late competence development ComFB family protein [Peptococcaceae bacterium]
MAKPDSGLERGARYILRNSYEEMVRIRTKEIMSRMDMCCCEKCYLDVCALVLNQLQPRYVTTEKGSLIAKLPEMSKRKELEMTVLISRAAKMVRDHPSHDAKMARDNPNHDAKM